MVNTPFSAATTRGLLRLILATSASLFFPGCLIDDLGELVEEPLDADGDGFNEDVDCDDLHPAINPAADEICDGDPLSGEGEVDNNCNGLRGDDDPSLNTVGAGAWYPDLDGDGFGQDDAEPFEGCLKPRGYVEAAGDCDDRNSSRRPDSVEVCGDDVDNNCDLQIDVIPEDSDEEGLNAPFWFLDSDGDGYGEKSSVVISCSRPRGDDGVATHVPPFLDSDSPLVTDWSTGSLEISDIPDSAFDCADFDPAINPGAEETCDAGDKNCDGDDYLGANDAPVWFRDADLDGYGDPTQTTTSCRPPSGYTPETSIAADYDCDDTNPTVNPRSANDHGGASCDGVDDDCDGTADNADGLLEWCKDDDGDSFPTAGLCVNAYCQPDTVELSYVAVNTFGSADWNDCDDTSPLVGPGFDEYCDAIDNNCDGQVDESSELAPALDPNSYYPDSDGDSFGDPDGEPILACNVPLVGGLLYSDNSDDCDDDDPGVSPAASEVCNTGLSEDCDTDLSDCLAGGGYRAMESWVGEPEGIFGYPWAAYSGPASSQYAGTTLISAGDLDVDGDSELAVRLLGSPTVAILDGGETDSEVLGFSLANTGAMITDTSANFGSSLAGGENLVGTRNEDLVVGAPGYATVGAVSLFAGPLSGSLTLSSARMVLTGPAGVTRFGGVVSLGEVNGDAYDAVDLLIAAAVIDHSTVTASSSAGAWIVPGSLPTGTLGLSSLADVVHLSGTAANIAGLGDPDGDGIDDLAVVSPAGIEFIYGDLALASCSLGACGDATLQPGGTFSAYTSRPVALAGLGDLDDDGLDDFAVGLPYASAAPSGEEGEVDLWFGSTTRLAGTEAADLWILGAGAGAHAGRSVVGGDLDGDGTPELLLGSPGEDDGTGSVYLFLGSELSPGASYSVYTAMTYFVGDPDQASRFGTSVAVLPDLFADGTADIAAGAPLHPAGSLANAGLVFLFGQNQ
jgi:hypothetical protein